MVKGDLKIPITEKGYEYTMPAEIKALVNREVLLNLKYELGRVFRDVSFETEADYTQFGSTYGWNKALKIACGFAHQNELYQYYRYLPWYDSDLFDSEITDLSVEAGVILKGGWERYCDDELCC